MNSLIDCKPRKARSLTVFLTAMLCLAFLPVKAFSQAMPSLAPMLEEVTPAVVNISTSRSVEMPEQLRFFSERDLRRFFQEGPGARQPDVPQARASGSGVIVDAEQGYVITNHHVVANADSITVSLKDGRQFEAELIGSDASTDIAMLQIEAEGLVALPMADVSSLRVGDYVVAIGNPFGIGQTVTSGIVSALGRAGLNNENYEDYIQTDAAINVGNSGGPLVDLQGRLLGINTAIISGSGTNSGVGFAVPADMVSAVMGHLQRDGYVRRGQLGVQIRNHGPEVESALAAGVDEGALVVAVMPDSAAEAAGLEASDVIVAIDGREISSGRELRNIIGLARVDKPMSLVFYRNGERQVTEVVLDASIDQIAENRNGAQESRRGLDERQFRGALLESASVAAGSHQAGVRVLDIQQQSPAWLAGLRPGDVIYELNREPVSDLRSFNELLADSEGTKALAVMRENRKLLVIVS